MTEVAELAGWTVGVTAARRSEELGEALARRGADVVYGAAMRTVPLEDDRRLRDATTRCLDDPLDIVVTTTAVGFRGWLDAAGAWGVRDRLVAALAGATVLTRGPKVRGAVRAAGLHEAWSPASESSDEVREHLLAHHDLAGKRVAVQLHGDPLRELVDAVRAAGAEVVEVPVYRWEPPADPLPLHELIGRIADRTLDAVTFTSAPAATNFLHTADELGQGDDVRDALRGPVLCAAVGPVTGAPLVAADLAVVSPERFRLGALVKLVADELPTRARPAVAAGRQVEIRGRAVVADGRLVPLPDDVMAQLHDLTGGRGGIIDIPDDLSANLRI